MRSKHRNEYVLWLETGIDSDDKELKRNLSNMYKNFQMYREPNTYVNFGSSLPKDQSCVFLILVGIQYEYCAKMIIDLPQIIYIYIYIYLFILSKEGANIIVRL
jgi:hypothetical protein